MISCDNCSQWYRDSYINIDGDIIMGELKHSLDLYQLHITSSIVPRKGRRENQTLGYKLGYNCS